MPNTIAVADRELPLVDVPEEPGWTENYCNQVYSPANGVGIWTHLSRMPGAPDLWRDVWIAYLPGDRFLVAKGHGTLSGERGPNGSMLRLTCEVPWQRWTMRFRGAAREVTGADLRSGVIEDGAHVLAEMTLSWEALAPVFDYAEVMSEQTWANSHYEQGGRVEGTLIAGDEQWQIAGTGIRDHSRGPRFYGTVSEDWWLSAQFPDGSSFAALEITNHGTDGPLLGHAFISDGTTVEQAELLGVELLEARADGSPLAHRTRLRTASGEHVIDGRIIQEMPFGLGEPNDIVLGVAYPHIPLALSECQTEYTWNGKVGYGLTERARTVTEAPADIDEA